MLVLEKEHRKLYLSQAEVARRSNMNATTLNQIMRGRMKAWPGQIARIEKVMVEAGWNGEGDLFAEVEE
jgi:transcriptional regulator with XRE-family HTH domain